MKNLLFGAVMLMGTFAFASSSIVLNENDLEKEEIALSTCYARHCVTYTGADGYEYKKCSDWEETDCKNIELAVDPGTGPTN